MNTLFFRLLQHEDKAAGLFEALDAVRQGHARNSVVHAVDPASFRQVPGAPFAYWVSERIRRLFTELPSFEGEGRTVKQGLATADDFRFIRAWWEVSPVDTLDGANGPVWQEELEIFQGWCRQCTCAGKRWVPFAKGGAYSPYYADLHLVVNWERDGEEIRSFDRAFIRNEDFYYRPGLTWPLRTQLGFNMRAYPAGATFGHKGPVAFVQQGDLPAYLSLANSRTFALVISLQMAFGSYEVGVVQRSPIPDCAGLAGKRLGELAWSVIALKQSLDTTDETSHAFVSPALLQTFEDTLAERTQCWTKRVTATADTLVSLQQQIDAVAYQFYGITEDEQRAIHDMPTQEDTTDDGEEDEEASEAESVSSANPRSLITDLLAYALGLSLGRWDMRYATEQRSCPELPDPFAPLTVCSTGMLVQADGLPAGPHDVPGDYPLRISWTGILVDDEGHPEDLGGRIRQVLEVLWAERASEIEHEACDLLGVRSLRDYFARPNNFFAYHLKRYSKSRRQAPIYWPLQTPSGSYTVWLYYPRLTDQTLYTCVNDVVDPKLTQTTEQLNALRTKTGRSTQEEKQLEGSLDFEQELKDFRDELLHVARFWKPNLNDGVQITAAPLWKLFQHKPWQKKLKETWTKLEKGDYDWAHLVYIIWPDRVREKCKRDKSLAIAHGLEELYETAPEPARKKRRSKQRRRGHE